MGTVADLLTEARRRRVFRTGGLYIVGAWVLLQVVSLALQALELPDALLRWFWLAAIAGFPLALIFGWYYDLTPAGIRRTRVVDGATDEDLQLGIPDYVIIAALAIVVGVLAAGIFDRARQDDALLGFDPLGIAVLPLEDLSTSPSDAYFSAGMQDALIATLSRIGELKVVSRHSSRKIDRSTTTAGIGRVLGVRNLVEGSVMRDGNRVRIIVQLVDAARDVQIWAGTFERELTSALGLQNDIANSIAEAIEVRLSDEEILELAEQPVMDADSYDTYLRAMYVINNGTNPERREGIALLESAVERDPDNALLHAGMAYGYALLGHSPFPEGMYPASKLASERALRLDDSLAEAHLARGMLELYYEWDFPAAENAFLRALEINPSLLEAHYHYAWLMELYNDDVKALAAGEKTVEISPLDAFMRGWLAEQYMEAGLNERALQVADETLDLEPGHAVATRVKALAFANLQDFDAALAESEKLAAHPLWGFVHGVVLAKAGRTEEAREMLDALEKTPRNVLALTFLNAALGDRDEMMRWVTVARDVKLPWYPWFITWYPDLVPFHDDPEIRRHAEALGLLEVLGT